MADMGGTFSTFWDIRSIGHCTSVSSNTICTHRGRPGGPFRKTSTKRSESQLHDERSRVRWVPVREAHSSVCRRVSSPCCVYTAAFNFDPRVALRARCSLCSPFSAMEAASLAKAPDERNPIASPRPRPHTGRRFAKARLRSRQPAPTRSQTHPPEGCCRGCILYSCCIAV